MPTPLKNSAGLCSSLVIESLPSHTHPLLASLLPYRSPYTAKYIDDMVAIFSQVFDYDHSWETVNKGVWRKYPNPYTTHVVSVDVIDRSIDPETGVIRTERVLGCKQAAPRWAVKILGGSEDAFVREVSFVDPQTSRTTITTVNLSLSQYMNVLESITYEPSRIDPTSKTQFTQTAEVRARMGMWRSLGAKLESWSVERFQSNAALGRQGFEHVLRMLCESQEEKVQS